MKNLYWRCIRRSGRWSDFFLLAAIIAAALIMLGTLVGMAILKLIPLEKVTNTVADGIGSLLQNPGALVGTNVSGFLSDYLNFIGIWIVLIAVVLIFKRNRPMMRCLGKRIGGKTILTAVIGFLLGFGFNGFCILISCLTGDIHLSFNEFNPGLFFAFLLAVSIQSGAEELGMRWYLYQKLRRRYVHSAVAIIGNAVVFTVMHLLNPGITIFSVLQIFLVGIFLSLLIYYYDAFWMAVFFHAAWNFTQNIIFGLPNSGIVSQYSLFRLEAASARNGFFYNVGFGVEGSGGAAILLAAACVVLIIINRKKREKRDLWVAYQPEIKASV